jgi:alpha-tubulin suppressor-like RCC1 family protein
MQVNSKMNRFNQLQLNWLKENIKDITRIICGRYHTFVIKNDGTVWATGRTANGELGLGDTTDRNTFTQLSSSFNNPKQISCGEYHTFIVKQDGTVWATGYNVQGQLGLGHNSNRTTFTQLSSSFNNPKQISCGGYHTFLIKQDGTVWATGRNDYGQLGLGDTNNRTTFTQLSSSFNNPKQISCGGYHTFLIKQDGTVWATGRNDYGQLGLGDTNNRTTFTQLSSSFNNPKQISCKYYHTFLIKQDGTVWATGWNYYGQLGLGDTTNRNSFTQLSSSFNNPKMISCGSSYTFIVKQDGTIWATGYNGSGQLGLGDTTNRNTFTQISSSFNNPKQISCGGYHTFIVKQDGTVWATGWNYYGQLGLGDTTNRSSFTQVNI